MARSSRRPTFWTGSTISNDMVPVGLNSYEMAADVDLTDEQDREPTLVRTIGRLVIGGTPSSDDSTHVANLFWGITLGSMVDANLPDPRDLSDDRWIITGFMRWVWYLAYYPVPTIPLVSQIAGTRAYQGPWEMQDFESHAMRKARTGDSLILRTHYVDAGNDTADRLDLNGSVRALWKAQ